MVMDSEPQPFVVLLLSGKRKSGKDYLATKLLTKFGEEIATIIHLSAPLKSEYSRVHSLDYDKLLGADSYKEQFRADMIEWGERKRREDASYFCRLATETPWVNGKKVWIICDARRKTDLEHFESFPHVLKIRVQADDETRRKRGFEFVRGIDDAESECGLDHLVNWDYIFDNSDQKIFADELEKLVQFIDDVADTVGDADLE